ncbi:paeninodin family lasso peptide [Paenibacillus sp. 1011MAR3C5]|nr:paeninodin family lasso peptide [Paenibacillus sp. 1011MAR3C5]
MMMAKKEWNKPELEVLQVQMTEASTHNGPFTDEAYTPGNNSEFPRFTS